MHSWFFSLQFRLILGFALVLALVIGSVSLYIGYAAQREVLDIQEAFDEARRGRVRQTFTHFYAVNGGWSGVQAVIDRAGFLADREIVVLDENGDVVGDSRDQSGASIAPAVSKGALSPIVFEGHQVGAIFVNPGKERYVVGRPYYGGRGRFLSPEVRDRFREPQLTRFAATINRSLLWAGIGTGLGGILLISLVSRRTLASVRALNSAAHRLGKGDLSERVPAPGRDEIGQLGHTFNAMAEGLEIAERQRRNMTADVAHELRTPLTNIQGYIEAVRDGVLKPDSATLDTIHEQVMYLSHLVEDLRLLAETEAEDFRLNRELDSLEDAIRSSVEAFRPRAESNDIAIIIEIASELPLVEFDRTRIAQIVGNLLENAIRHTPSGGVVTVSARVEESRAKVTVADSGEGISPEEVPLVFERFYRVDPSRTRTTGGVGLGLTIAKQLVEAHGGSIRASSPTGKGSRFIFDLPLTNLRPTTSYTPPLIETR